MIHSARLTGSPLVNIVFTFNLFRFARFWRTDSRMDNKSENNDHFRRAVTVGRPSGSILKNSVLRSFILNEHIGYYQKW